MENTIKFLGSVDSEGGPLLLVDIKSAGLWKGSEGDASDYTRACDVVERSANEVGGRIDVGGRHAIVWDTEGPGTADIFIDEQEHLIIVRAWLDENNGLEPVSALAGMPLNEVITIGSLEVPTGVLAVFWSADTGEGVTANQSNNEVDADGGFSGVLVNLPIGRYVCLHDEVEMGDMSARRCHLMRDASERRK